jgi:hypothetical protein
VQQEWNQPQNVAQVRSANQTHHDVMYDMYPTYPNGAMHSPGSHQLAPEVHNLFYPEVQGSEGLYYPDYMMYDPSPEWYHPQAMMMPSWVSPPCLVFNPIILD